MSKTKVIPNEFKGQSLFTVYEVDESESPVSDFPVVNFGIKKAKAVLKHVQELREFVNSQSS